MRVSLPTRILPGSLPFMPSTRPTAQPSFNTRSGVMGSSPTLPRTPSVPKNFRLPISRSPYRGARARMRTISTVYRLPHSYRLHTLRDIMHAQDPRAILHRDDGERHT